MEREVIRRGHSLAGGQRARQRRKSKHGRPRLDRPCLTQLQFQLGSPAMAARRDRCYFCAGFAANRADQVEFTCGEVETAPSRRSLRGDTRGC